MFRIFSKEKRTLRLLVKLSHATISRMETLLAATKDARDRAAISAHLTTRREELAGYIRTLKGADDEFDTLTNPVRTGRADNLRQTMVNELRYFTTDPITFGDYLDDIRPLGLSPIPRENVSESLLPSDEDRQALRDFGWTDEDVEIMGPRQRAAELREIEAKIDRQKARKRRRDS